VKKLVTRHIGHLYSDDVSLRVHAIQNEVFRWAKDITQAGIRTQRIGSQWLMACVEG
jgi:hypothetical protein